MRFILFLSLITVLVSCAGNKRAERSYWAENPGELNYLERPYSAPEKYTDRPVFTATNVAPGMLLFGTGQNYRGAVTAGQAWVSGGEGPHYLLLDGQGVFEGLALDGLSGVSNVKVYLKTGTNYDAGVTVPFTGPDSAAVRFAATGAGVSNFVNAGRIKLELAGTDVSLSNVMVYGVLSGKKDSGKALKYPMTEAELAQERAVAKAMAEKNYLKAVNEAQKSIRINPENPYPYMNMAQIYQQMAEKNEDHDQYLLDMHSSVENYRAGDRSDNPYRDTLVDRMARIYELNLLDSAKARETWQHYLEIIATDGQNDGNKVASVITRTIVINSGTGYEEKANKVAELLVKGEVKPNNMDAYDCLVRYGAYLIRTKKDYQAAADLSRQIISRFTGIEQSDYPYGHENLAVASMAMGKWEDAIEAWKGFINIKKGSGTVEIYQMIAYCYQKMGNIDLSFKNYVMGVHREQFKVNTDYQSKSIKFVKDKREQELIKTNDPSYQIVVIIYPDILKNLQTLGLLSSKYQEFILQTTLNYLNKYGITVKK